MSNLFESLLDHYDEYAPIYWIIALGLSLFLALAVIGDFYSRYQCNNYEKLTGLRTEYVIFDICYVHYDGRIYRWDEYVARAAASEGLNNIAKEH